MTYVIVYYRTEGGGGQFLWKYQFFTLNCLPTKLYGKDDN